MAHTLLAVPLASNHIMHPSTVNDACAWPVLSNMARREGAEPTVKQAEIENWDGCMNN